MLFKNKNLFDINKKKKNNHRKEIQFNILDFFKYWLCTYYHNINTFLEPLIHDDNTVPGIIQTPVNLKRQLLFSDITVGDSQHENYTLVIR